MREGRSTEDAILKLKELIDNLESPRIDTILIDIKGSFNYLWRLTILESPGNTGK